MRRFLCILFHLFFVFQEATSQDFYLRPVALSTKERKDNKLVGHYRFNYDGYSGSELYLYRDGQFAYTTFSDVSRQTSGGKWKSKGNIIELKSEIGKGTLPVKVSYTARVSDTHVKKLAVVRDLAGKEYFKAAIYVNNDTVACFGGDLECLGSYTSVDSVKVAVNDEVYSHWIKVDGSRGIIQLTLQTKVDLDRYLSMHMRLRREKGKLKCIKA